MLFTLALAHPATAADAPHGRHALSQKELALGDRLHRLRVHGPPRAWSPKAATEVAKRISGPRVKRRIRVHTSLIQARARRAGDWTVLHRGFRFWAMRRVLSARGWTTAAEQTVRDRARQAREQARALAALPPIVRLGRLIQARGYQVGEHPAFGGMCDCHSPTGYHPQGRAVDVNCDGCPGGEMAALDRLHAWLVTVPGIVELLWRTAGHHDHLHVAM